MGIGFSVTGFLDSLHSPHSICSVSAVALGAAPRAPPKNHPRQGRRGMQCSMPSGTPHTLRVHYTGASQTSRAGTRYTNPSNPRRSIRIAAAARP